MTRSIQLTIACSFLLIVSSACSKPAPNATSESPAAPVTAPPRQRVTSESVVEAVAQPVEITRGGSAEAVVRLTIQSGYHINANPPTFPYLKATTLEIPAIDGIAVSFVTYPKALAKQFAFAEKPLAIYEGETEVKATLKAEKTVRTGERSLPAQLRIQACDDQVCYPPGTIELSLPVNVK